MTTRLNPDVVFRVLGDAAVLVQLSTDSIFELNATGSRIWSGLERGAPVADIVAELVRDFDVDTSMAERECQRLIDDLTARGLLLP